MLAVSALIKSKGHIWSTSPEATVLDALRTLSERNVGVVPVVDASGKLIGIFGERDYARRVVLVGKTEKDTQIKDVMTKNVVTVNADVHIEECMKIVVSKGFRHLPVLEDGDLIGIVSTTDLLAEVIRSREKQIGSLQSLLSGASEIT